MKRILVAFLAIASTLAAQSATPISYPAASMSSLIGMEAQAIPTSPTVVTTRNLVFGGGWISCGSSARTVTLTDGNSVNILPAVSIAANQIQSLSVIAGAYVSGGFSISASGSGCSYHAWWKQ